jgi:SulP family sulfate permease
MSRPHTAVLGRIPESHVFRNVERYPDVEVADDVAVLRVDVSLSYLNSTFLKRRIAQLRADHPGGLRAVVLDCSGVNDLDSSAEHTLHEVDDELAAAGVELHLAAVKGPVRDVLDRSGLAAHLATRLHLDADAALATLRRNGTGSTGSAGSLVPPTLGLDTDPASEQVR